jgi:hypothetical protein
MPNYSTITDGTPSSRSGSPGEMNRQRRSRAQKDGGGHASMISSNVNLVNTSMSRSHGG